MRGVHRLGATHQFFPSDDRLVDGKPRQRALVDGHAEAALARHVWWFAAIAKLQDGRGRIFLQQMKAVTRLAVADIADGGGQNEVRGRQQRGFADLTADLHLETGGERFARSRQRG